MQKILKIHLVDPEENASQTTDGQTDGQMNRTDFVAIMFFGRVQSCFSEIRE